MSFLRALGAVSAPLAQSIAGSRAARDDEARKQAEIAFRERQLAEQTRMHDATLAAQAEAARGVDVAPLMRALGLPLPGPAPGSIVQAGMNGGSPELRLPRETVAAFLADQRAGLDEQRKAMRVAQIQQALRQAVQGESSTAADINPAAATKAQDTFGMAKLVEMLPLLGPQKAEELLVKYMLPQKPTADKYLPIGENTRGFFNPEDPTNPVMLPQQPPPEPPPGLVPTQFKAGATTYGLPPKPEKEPRKSYGQLVDTFLAAKGLDPSTATAEQINEARIGVRNEKLNDALAVASVQAKAAADSVTARLLAEKDAQQRGDVPLTDKQLNMRANLAGIKNTVNMMDQRVDRLFKPGGLFDRAKRGGGNLAAYITQDDPDVVLWEESRGQIGTGIARLREVGVLTDNDYRRATGLIPHLVPTVTRPLPDTLPTAKAKIRELNKLIDAAYEAWSVHGTGGPTGPVSVPANSGQPGQVPQDPLGIR